MGVCGAGVADPSKFGGVGLVGYIDDGECVFVVVEANLFSCVICVWPIVCGDE